MKMALRAVIATLALTTGVSVANAMVGSNVATLRTVAPPAAQPVFWWLWVHERCWRHHGEKICKTWRN